MDVLILEDDVIARKALSKLLQQSGHSVVQVGCLADAFHAVEKQLFDLILIDLMLPDGAGENFIEHVRKQKSVAHVIIMTGCDEERRKFLDKYKVQVITKPFTDRNIDYLVRMNKLFQE